MPVYAYRCSRGHQFEVMQRMTEDPVQICLECGAPVIRIFHPVGIIFKGQGFYKTDSRGASTGDSADGKATPTPKDTPATSSKESKDTGPATSEDTGSAPAPKPTTETASS